MRHVLAVTDTGSHARMTLATGQAVAGAGSALRSTNAHQPVVAAAPVGARVAACSPGSLPVLTQ